jgi:hypothetical protein
MELEFDRQARCLFLPPELIQPCHVTEKLAVKEVSERR